jgi:hypothetical protein
MHLFCPRCKAAYSANRSSCQRCNIPLVPRESLQPFCPICKKDFPADADFCPECLVELVFPAKASASEAGENSNAIVELVTVYETWDPAEIAVIKGSLDSAGIVFCATGEGVQNLLGLGLMGGFNPLTGPVKFDVDRTRQDEARALIDAIVSNDSSADTPDEA